MLKRLPSFSFSVFFFSLGLWLWCQPLFAQVIPGGMISSQYFAQGEAVKMSVDFEIIQSPPVNSNHYWAVQFYANSSIDHGGYFGIQTNGYINAQAQARMFIFSIWNAVDAEAGPNAFAESFGHEGSGYSVRVAFEWKTNTVYTFQLSKEGEFWWRLDVFEEDGESIYLGRIKITEDVLLKPYFANFIENYWYVDACEAIDYGKARISSVNFNGILYPPQDPYIYGACPENSVATISNGSIFMETGMAQYENQHDLDADGIPDIHDDDIDNDGYSNSYEGYFGTNPSSLLDYPVNVMPLSILNSAIDKQSH